MLFIAQGGQRVAYGRDQLIGIWADLRNNESHLNDGRAKGVSAVSWCENQITRLWLLINILQQKKHKPTSDHGLEGQSRLPSAGY